MLFRFRAHADVTVFTHEQQAGGKASEADARTLLIAMGADRGKLASHKTTDETIGIMDYVAHRDAGSSVKVAVQYAAKQPVPRVNRLRLARIPGICSLTAGRDRSPHGRGAPAMPVAPRVTRGQLRRDDAITTYDEPVAVLVVLRWQGRGADAVELVPGWKRAEAGPTGGPATVVRVEWMYAPAGRGSERREVDWFRASDVLDRQPSEEEWREIVGRPVWA